MSMHNFTLIFKHAQIELSSHLRYNSQSCRLIAVVANAVLLMGINITGNFGHLAAITLVEVLNFVIHAWCMRSTTHASDLQMIPSLNDDFWCSLYNFENCSVLTPLSRSVHQP